MPVFVDSNVLLYARDSTERSKQPRAVVWLASLWQSRTGRVSFQVLQEFYVVATQQLKPGLSADEARAYVRSLLAWRPLQIEAKTMEAAWAISDRFRVSFWDALIVAAAQATGCDRLLTEDLQDGQLFDGVRVVDPFTHEPEAGR